MREMREDARQDQAAGQRDYPADQRVEAVRCERRGQDEDAHANDIAYHQGSAGPETDLVAVAHVCTLEGLVEGDWLAVLDHALHLAQALDVLQRITGHGHQVGGLVRCDRAQFLLLAQQASRIDGGRADCL